MPHQLHLLTTKGCGQQIGLLLYGTRKQCAKPSVPTSILLDCAYRRAKNEFVSRKMARPGRIALATAPPGCLKLRHLVEYTQYPICYVVTSTPRPRALLVFNVWRMRRFVHIRFHK